MHKCYWLYFRVSSNFVKLLTLIDKMFRKRIFILSIFYLIIFNCLTSCKCSKDDQIIINLRLRDSSNSFIPELKGSVTFESDSQKYIVFDKVETTRNFDEFDDCVEGCCNHVFNQESKRLGYNNKDYLSIQIFTYALDSFDDFSIVMGNNCGTCPSDFASLVRYINHDDIANILNYKNKNIIFDSTLNLAGKTFNDVFSFSSISYSPDKKFAEKIYYNKNDGVIGFVLNDKSVWVKK